jgi:hypothetical protein
VAKRKNGKTSEQGSALVYILIAIALLAALTISFMEPSSQQTQSQSGFKMVSEIEGQVEFIRSNVQECIILYPGGDITINDPVVTDPGASRIFPLDPRSAHLTDPSTETDPLVKELRCPGNPGDNPDHQPVFSGTSGKFLPPPPPMFTDWKWYNGADGVFFWTSTDKTDAFIQTALTKLNDQFGKCEADVIDASAMAKNLDGAGDYVCPAGSYCFRVWMVTDKNNVAPDDAAMSVFPDESADCP